MRQYRLKATADAERVERAAAVASDHSKDANQRADNYMLAVVLFASSLFFAGISSKIESAGARTVGPRARLRALPRRRRVARDVAGEARHLGARSITRFG
jgi:hypothetical protein